MATLGKLWAQQLGFTITTTTGTVYTHALGYTPTVILLTPFGTNAGTQGAPFYTAANTQTVIIGAASAVANCDVAVGSFHSIIS